MEALMRVLHILAVASVVLTAVGLKLVMSPPMKAEADVTPIVGMNVLQIQTNRPNLPVQKIRDMTFILTGGV
jgi:heme/copper-type cytochrome/quinol oxidase subunit 4